MQSVLATAMLLVFLAGTTVYGQPARTIFVGPQSRDGFLDVDVGIRDSIGDLQREFARSQSLKLIDVQEEALLALIILGRGVVTQSSIGVGGSSVAEASVLVTPLWCRTMCLRLPRS